ncbi:hypothetical protein GNG27_14590 [Leclercia sp. 119287]|uniref:host specificity factor TipJ family phage tail protein n=1 Tax=Leclercia sp. 119287 TaxID=2681308 RepID=UPI0012E1672B|nr:host specificity factor TipJ family phage tail protein [Leclercia sp. 119287]QGU15837.1 hypothetical protein GNG27_14590 [Leclercia sp. 119287]
MTIRIYPSRLPGEPLETHHHETLTLSAWFAKNVEGWTPYQQHPVAVEIDGVPVPPAEWVLYAIRPDSDVRMYPVPYGTGAEIALWVAVSVAVASAAYSIYMMSTMQTGAASQPGSGDQLELNPAKANMAKLGDPVREIFGRYRVWPDYVTQPVNRLAAQSDRRINVTPTRLYDGHASRTISGALYHVLESLGFKPEQIDHTAIDTLEQNYWTPRGETFDWATGDSKSALEVLKIIAGAGMGYFMLSDGLVSAGREGVKNWTGMITPQETTEELQTAFKAPSQDDYDGVDVTYINGTTWAEETVQCRLPGNPTPVKVEEYKLEGVVDKDRAYRIGMRRLLGYRLQRLQHTTTTEMDALCYQFMDRIILADDVPGSQTLSCLITEMSWDSTAITLTLSEPPDWSFPNPRVVVRHQDGRASALLVPARIDDYSLRIPYSAALTPEEWDMDSPYIEPPRLLFCSSSRVGYEALVGEISPGSDGTSSVTAIQYHPGKYQYDDAIYPGDVA